jgi:alpha-galactosidase
MNSNLFSFKYDEKNIKDVHCKKTVRVEDGKSITEFLFDDGLKVTNILTDLGGAYDWVTWYENTADNGSKMLSEIYDCDVEIPFEYDALPKSRAFIADGVNTLVFNPTGSIWADNEFTCETEKFAVYNRRFASIFPGEKKEYITNGGRSSDPHLPFFDINRADKGVIFAVGWTGQWFCRLERDDENIRIITGIENTNFYLKPHEKIRTSSVMMFTYDNGQNTAHNKLRSIIRKHYSQIGQYGREKHAPFSCNLWGGLDSETAIRRINKISEEKLGYEYLWIDAGWYGNSKLPCPNEFEGDWANHVGDWNINKNYHPDEFRDVAKTITDNGLKFLLWFEPERVFEGTSIAEKHPEWLLKRINNNGNIDVCSLLNLGNDEARQWCFEMLKAKISALDIRCYRQDFNFEPLYYWRQADEPGRNGIHEIKHIMGMYTLWDALLNEFPNLIIDNCASGGRRIDIETLKRSTPLWRSDYQCPANHDPDVAQNHTLGISWWLPFNGTAIGRLVGDVYRMRSCYTTALGNGFIYSSYEDDKEIKPETFDWLRKYNAEYKVIREYMEHDYYPLTEAGTDKDKWCATQFDIPEEGKGVILAFRREKSPFDSAWFKLGNIDAEKIYTFTDSDSGEEKSINGAELIKNGLNVVINEKRSSRIIFYKV